MSDRLGQRGFWTLLLFPLLASSHVVFGQAGSAVIQPTNEQVLLNVESIQISGFEGFEHNAVDAAELQRELALERQRFGAQLTVGDLHGIADALTLFFRRKGYAFHTVFLPPQTVRSGRVQLKLQVGRLADVHVINQTSLPSERLASVFDELRKQLLFAPRIEQKVQALKMQEGFEVFAFFSRGVKPGEARLNLRVTESRKSSWSLRADNYGSENTGKHRLLAAYSRYQLTGHHDTLSMAILRGVDEEENTYGSLQYRLPFYALQYQLDFSLSNHQFDLGDTFANLGLQGATKQWSLGVTHYQDLRARTRSSVRLGYTQKENTLSQDSDAIQEEETSSISLAWSKRFQPESGRWLSQTSLDLSYGDEQIKNQQYSKLGFSQYLFAAVGSARIRNVFQFSLRGQYAGDTELPQLEGLALTGSYGVRGFEPGLFSADSGVIASLEWRWPNILITGEGHWRLEPFLHTDWAHGESSSGQNSSRATFISGGLGVRFNLGQYVNGQLTMADAIKGEDNSVEVESDKQLLFELRWQY